MKKYLLILLTFLSVGGSLFCMKKDDAKRQRVNVVKLEILPYDVIAENVFTCMTQEDLLNNNRGRCLRAVNRYFNESIAYFFTCVQPLKICFRGDRDVRQRNLQLAGNHPRLKVFLKGIGHRDDCSKMLDYFKGRVKALNFPIDCCSNRKWHDACSLQHPDLKDALEKKEELKTTLQSMIVVFRDSRFLKPKDGELLCRQISEFRELRCLQLGEHVRIFDRHLNPLASLKKLQVLSLEECLGLTLKGVSFLLSNLNLKELNISACNGVDFRFIEKLREKFPDVSICIEKNEQLPFLTRARKTGTV